MVANFVLFLQTTIKLLILEENSNNHFNTLISILKIPLTLISMIPIAFDTEGS